MEISKLIICRQDVIILSDADSESNDVNANKKKKRKRKTKCIRNVKFTTMTVNRIVPSCFRQRCKNGDHYRRPTSMNTKYRRRITVPTHTKYKRSQPPTKGKLRKSHRDKDKINNNMALNRDLCSPITIASSSDTYENISSCSFNIASSDSDELEDLISLTRKRMKNDSENYNIFPIRKSVCAPITQDIYQDISSNDDVLNSSIHSMDTILLCHGDTMAPHPRSPENLNQGHLEHHNNNNLDPIFMCADYKHDKNIFLQQKITSLESKTKNNLSPLYEISGKVFMEHYLNTSFI